MKLWRREFPDSFDVPEELENTPLEPWLCRFLLAQRVRVRRLSSSARTANTLRLWIDHENPAERETPENKRFHLGITNADNDEHYVLLDSEDLQETLTAIRALDLSAKETV